ncbi:hypothetical protein ACFVZH_38335 [Streptomyces sp. NPDC059534]|uniref:hypothetical protein n=1 Tax=Streptomyces sp. NPDC059534 TaxID=3346859 RepID=UPI0036A387A2
MITQGVKVATRCDACGGVLTHDMGQFIDRGIGNPQLTDGVVDGDWISDADSYFRHLSQHRWGSSHSTACGINLGEPGRYLSHDAMTEHAVGKPQCSACTEGVRV